jgi:hypothetical protein
MREDWGLSVLSKWQKCRKNSADQGALSLQYMTDNKIGCTVIWRRKRGVEDWNKETAEQG